MQAESQAAAELGRLFSGLVRSYIEFGWPFALLHLAVLVVSVSSLLGLRREIQHLENWTPGSSVPGNQATRILDSFIEESRALGSQGILVPVTDFSDRLDSIAEGRVAELYERINLFLIVGIAGTLFGVFEFAQDAQVILAESPGEVHRLGASLSSSLAKAFPVGFVGLALMFVGQLVASIFENRFKRAVATATGEALERRSGDMTSQAQIIENASERIERALQPLERLQETMAEHLAPVVDKLGERLDQSLYLVRDQFDALQQTTDRFAVAGHALGKNVEALGANIGRLDSLLATAPEVLDSLLAAQKEQEAVLKAFQDDMAKSLDAGDEAIRALKMATGAAEKLPEQILAETKNALQDVSLAVSDASNIMVAELKNRLTADYNHLFQRIDQTIEILRGSLLGASKQLADNLKEGSGHLFAAIQKQVDFLEATIQGSDRHLATSLAASQGAIAALNEMSGRARALPGEILEASKSTLGEVSREASSTFQTMATDLNSQLSTQTALLQEKMAVQVQIFRESLNQTSADLQNRLAAMSNEMLDGFKGQIGAVQSLVGSTTNQLERSDEYLKKSLAASTETIVALDRMSQDAEKLPSRILAALDSSLTQIAGDASEVTRQMAEELKGALSGSSERLFKDVEASAQGLRENLDAASGELLGRLSLEVRAVQELISHTTTQYQEINMAAKEAVDGLRGLHETGLGILKLSFTGMSQEAGQVWGQKSEEFRRQTQDEVYRFLEKIQALLAHVESSLERSARTWSDAAINARTMIEEPIAQVMQRVGDDLQRKIRDLDNLLMADHYPKVIKDVNNFTQGLQGLLAQAEAIQKGLDHWAVSVERSQEETERARQIYLDNLSQDGASAVSSSELADIVDAKLEEKIEPVRSALEELGRRERSGRLREKVPAWIKALFQRRSS